MADNLTTQSTTPATVPSASVIATDDVTGVHFQKVKLDVGGDGVSVPATGDGTNGLDVDVTRVQGTVTVDDGGSTLSVDDGGGSLTVDGTVGVSGSVAVTGTFYQATQPVSGTVAVTGAYQATQPVSLATAPTTPVTGTFWQATQPVSGTVTATGPLTDTELRATAVSVSGPLTDTQIRATALPVSGTVAVTGVATAAKQLPDGHNVVVTSAPTTAVTGSFYPATQPVSGSVSVTGVSTETTLLSVKGKTDNIPALGAAARVGAIPVTMASDQPNINVAINNTPNVNGIPTTVGQKSRTTSLAVTLSSDDITSLTPPSPISGFATDTKQSDRSQKSQVTDGTRDATVKAASTAAVAADTALVVAISPNNTLNVANAPIASMTKGNMGSATSTANTQIVAAVAGKQLAITSVSVANTGAAATLVRILDGSTATVLCATIAPPGGGSNMTFPTPLLTTSGNGLYFSIDTASTTVYVSAAGYSI